MAERHGIVRIRWNAAVPAVIFGLLASAASGLRSAPAVKTAFGPFYAYGMCDASAVVALDDHYVAAADDEKNILNVYRVTGGKPIYSLPLSAFLQVDMTKPEEDTEGGARIGDRCYWISSHGRNARGEDCPNRQRFYATEIDRTIGVPVLRPAGQPYKNLLADLLREPRLERFQLRAAAALAPKAKGGLNIEALGATPEGHLLIGLRNPIPQGQALIVPLLNPAELILGKPARFGDPVLLDLEGLGIRSLSDWHKDGYFLVAGHYDETPGSRLYFWDGQANKPQRVAGGEFAGFNPESLAFCQFLGQERLMVVSDDGTVTADGKPCKKLKNPLKKKFRAMVLEVMM